MVAKYLGRNLVSDYNWGVRSGQIAFMIHSCSRNVGKYIGGMWRDWARDAWPKNLKYPESELFPLSLSANPELVHSYLQAEATAANYGFINRLLLAELLRLRLRQVFGDIEAPLVYDLPHNITLAEGAGWVTRKGACPAYVEQPLIIPGSMGAPSYLLIGKGNDRFLRSASHGAGRARSRFDMSREGVDKSDTALGLNGVDCITLREERRIEEAPAAYKPIQPVIDAQVEAQMVDVVAKMNPQCYIVLWRTEVAPALGETFVKVRVRTSHFLGLFGNGTALALPETIVKYRFIDIGLGALTLSSILRNPYLHNCSQCC